VRVFFPLHDHVLNLTVSSLCVYGLDKLYFNIWHAACITITTGLNLTLETNHTAPGLEVNLVIFERLTYIIYHTSPTRTMFGHHT